jgi:uncharacterized protein YjeT (DUF2065 family)
VLTVILLAIGLVFILEGLVLALAPSRLRQVLEMLVAMPVEARRLVGLLAVTCGGIVTALTLWLL